MVKKPLIFMEEYLTEAIRSFKNILEKFIFLKLHLNS